MTELIIPLLAQQALAFVPSNQPEASRTIVLCAEKICGNDAVAAAAATLLAGVSLISTQLAAANEDTMSHQQTEQYFLTTGIASSTSTIAELDQFSLPSYDSSKGSKLIDLSSEVETVNKKSLAQAKARREYIDTSAEKLEADKLRLAERDGGSLLESMVGTADRERKAAVEAEKAEARANRWKTF